MSEHAQEDHTRHYVAIWVILLVLLAISVLGPELGIKIVTLITAFGVAVVKGWLVAKNFMHVNVQPRYVLYLLGTCLAFMLLFFSGTAPDVMKHEGSNWIKPEVSIPLSRGAAHELEEAALHSGAHHQAP